MEDKVGPPVTVSQVDIYLFFEVITSLCKMDQLNELSN